MIPVNNLMYVFAFLANKADSEHEEAATSKTWMLHTHFKPAAQKIYTISFKVSSQVQCHKFII